MSSDIHLATWGFMRGIYREWYAPRPELTLVDWLADMRRAHAALLGKDARIDVTLSESIAILEQALVVRGGRLPPELDT